MSGRSKDVASAVKGVAVTASDATILETTRGLWVGSVGDVAVKFAGSTTAVTLVAVPAGTLLPVQVVQVMSTNTTASSIVALY